jgi:hypothetical protein
MLHRAAGTALLLTSLLLGGCKSSTPSYRDDAPPVQTRVVAPLPGAEEAAKAPPGKHGDKWADPEDPKTVGGFSMFKEAWVYVDGKPVGVLRELELPPLPEVWIEDVEYLDFKAGDPGPHERLFELRRWRLVDYFKAVGVDVKKIKAVLLHGGRGVAVLEGDLFARYGKDVTFDLTGNNDLKLRVYLPKEFRPTLNTSFDRYAAISVIVDKPVPGVNKDNTLILDGVELAGIPYYGQPLRGGIRVYVDGRLEVIIKRNALGDQGRITPGVDRWSVAGLLAAHGIDAGELAAADVVDKASEVTRLEGDVIGGLTFETDPQAQGAIKLSTGQLTNAILLWKQGKVPPKRVKTPKTRDK